MARKRLLVYSPLAIWQPPIYETQLEIVQDYLERGFDVTMLTCEASLPTCEANVDHLRSVCVLCRSRARSGVNWLSSEHVAVIDYLLVTDEQRASVERFAETEIVDVQQLRSLQLDGSDIGMAVLSSLVSLTREPSPDTSEHRDVIRRGLRAAGLVHYSLRNHITRLAPDVLLLFNGRVASLRPALRAGQALGVETLVYEVAGAPNRYLITVNTYPHDLEALKEVFNGTFDDAPETIETKASVADAWYEARIANRPHDGMAFTEAQEVGRLPKELAVAGLRVGIFISSDDEFVAIDGWEPPVYRGQADGLRRILGAFSSRDDIQFILRVHPHLRGIENSQTRELEQIAASFPSLHVVAADSPVHTYSLIEAVDVVLTFGSTVAMEAVYMGKPSLMLGRHVFEDMGGVKRPTSHEELVDLLLSAADNGVQQPSQEARDAAIRFGFAQSRFGLPYRFVQRTGPDTAILRRNGREYRVTPGITARIVSAPSRGARYVSRRLHQLIGRATSNSPGAPL